MKTFVVILIIVLAAVGAYWLFTDQEAETPESNTDVMEENGDGMMHDEDAMMEDMGDAMEGNDYMMDDSNDGMEDDGSTGSAPPAGEPARETKTFNITGAPFEFSTTEIRVNQGDTVVINFESVSGFHDWVVDEFDASTQQVNPGTTTSVTFVADQTGTFEYYCSVGNHRAMGMVGTLIVE